MEEASAADPPQSVQEDAPAKARKRPRVLMQVDGNVTAHQKDVDIKNLSEYEIQRLERIKHNKQRMEEMGLLDAVTELRETHAMEAQQARPPPRPRALASHKPKNNPPPAIRRSTRSTAAGEKSTQEGNTMHRLEDDDVAPAMLTLEAYFDANNIDYSNAIRATGFTGWVNPVVRQEYGIAETAAGAWESQGGGKFSRKIDKKAIPAHIKAKGWSDAKAHAATQLLKNPNQYFYRLTAPGIPQAQGDWSEEEHTLFVNTMRQHGVGDKWGLFASYIPNRVGYQCSAYYREVIIPSGLVLDTRFRISHSGKAEYVG